ncbi:MAG: efflux RND transporter permease subunit [Planctomycetota bacterium]|nr:MAG: efflux RND transporter permease subunit [Planctomycetota bacterium]
MHPIDACIRHPVKVTVGVLLLMLFGAVALLRMPMQLTPEVQTPTITIETRWPGASPQEVEREIVQEQEEFLKSVEGLRKMTSECSDSVGRITLEFNVGTDMESALLKVNSRLSQVPDYPEDADEPVITTASSADRPIAWFILSARLPDRSTLIDARDRHRAAGRNSVAEALQRVLDARNPGLAELRLRNAAERHPELRPLLPRVTDIPTLRKFAEDVIEAAFERVPGVANSNVLGGREPQMRVIVDAERLAARGLTLLDVRDALRRGNRDTSAGDFWEGKRRYVVRTLGQYRSPEQVADQILAIHDGSPVFVRDVADVRLGYAKPDGFVRRFGSDTIAINCIRDTGANVLSVMTQLRQVNRILNEGILKQRGLVLTQVYDETDYIRSAIGLVNQNIILGGALTAIVLMVFLHPSWRTAVFVPAILLTAVLALTVTPWFFALTVLLIVGGGLWFARGALVVALAIPVSLVGTFLILHGLGRSLNVISLAGLAFAVGMLVDNAVVVLENVYRHYRDGLPPFQAAAHGTREVWGAILASTLTTLAVFLPVVFIQEEAGQLFRDIALAISGAVGLSLLVSLVVIPPAAARLFRSDATPRPDEVSLEKETVPLDAGRGQSEPPVAEKGIRGRARRFVEAVAAANRFVLQSRARQLAVTVGLAGSAVLVTWAFWPKVEYLPNGNRNLVFGIVMPPPGYNLEKLKELGQKVEDALRPYWDVDPDSDAARKLPFPPIGDFFYVARGRSVFVGLRAADPLRAGELVPLVFGLRNRLPGAIVVASQSSLFERGLTAGRTIDIEITGPELPRLVELGGQVMRAVAPVLDAPADSVPAAGQMASAGERRDQSPRRSATQARPIPSLDLSNPEVHIVPRPVVAADAGLTATDLGFMVNALVDGAYVTDYFMGGEKIDLIVMGSEEYSARTQDLGGLYVATPLSPLPLPLDAVAEVRLSSGPEQINHRERQRAITIQVTPPPELPLEEAIQRIDERILTPLRDSGALQPPYAVNLSGTADKLRQTWEALRGNVLLALLITYLLMAALFEAWVYPLVIIASVPLGAVGGILGLHLLNAYTRLLAHWQGLPPPAPQSLDVLTMLGFVILIGTVVNNAILIVHQALTNIRDHGQPTREAVLHSVRTRIRPIFMTTITTVLGLAPLVLFPGAGSELYRGLGSVVLGGLVVSTVFTLILIPALFVLCMESLAAVHARLTRAATTQAAA